MINHVIAQRYEVLEKAGEGPLFTVYKARDRASNRIVALKAITPEYADDENYVKTLRASLTASSVLNHPNITHFHEFGQDEETPYGIFEFVRGINLKERIRRIAPFTLSVAVDVACSVAEALQYAHAAGQPHGDLRPHNIIISPEGAVKITDFGVMAAVARSSEAQQQTLLRAAAYHAPELSMTQPGSIGGDIYALGAVLYEMLTGTPLFAADTLEAVADMHAFQPIPSPRTINPGVPRSIEGIILKCLQKRPDSRYRSAGDLLTDLKAVRDALRFGKPLSWSPIDVDKLAAETAAPGVAAGSSGAFAATAPATTASAVPLPTGTRRPNIENREPARALEPVADVTASSQAVAMSTKSRTYLPDDRVSIAIKIAIGVVTALIIACLFGFVYIYTKNWVDTPQVTIPVFVGRSIEEVRNVAEKNKLRLIEHGEYTDKPRNIVYKTDQDTGAQIHQNHSINVWYSKGPTYVQVPDLHGLPRDEAEQKLKDSGLTVGRVTPEFSNSVPQNSVVAQNVSYKKRVLHDTAVDLVVSDGPKPDYADSGAPTDSTSPANQDPNSTEPNRSSNIYGDGSTPPNDSSNPNAGTVPPSDSSADSMHNFKKTLSIPKDGRGPRTVRVVYTDAHGLEVEAINEDHNEGDKIPLDFDYVGRQITLRVYYNSAYFDNKEMLNKTFDPQATQNQTIR